MHSITNNMHASQLESRFIKFSYFLMIGILGSEISICKEKKMAC